ncbi:hypothetical protein [Thermoflavifilum thermophilum]|uniref:Universal stress protein family protein n=1 Tax=Thermoflavifilum thermophilum TaxID=1393122 RepID=A0A1I7NK15_9BACT|nr:hypothetical protein [Thermoflavifilum thermophilum]SFV35004.1 hypothetical protein SAMN05660895_2135 [Thermoflavifilum thermophilum]
MLKILFYTDGMYFKPEILNFPAYLAHLTHTKILEVYLDDMLNTALWYDQRSFVTIPGQIAEKERYEAIEKNFQKLLEEADKKGLLVKSFEDGTSTKELFFKHMRYSDLLLLDIHSLNNPSEDIVRYKFFRDILMYGECPVMLISDSIDHIDEILFAYNGTPSSVFAIKQFSYLFPQFMDKPVRAIYAQETEKMQDKKLLIDWLNAHYMEAYYEETEEKLLDSFLTSYRRNKQIMGVMGSFGRSLLSQMLHKSEALHLMKMLPIPLFISHW